MNYADTRINQRVTVVHHRYYPDRFVGQTGKITQRYDGIDADHGIVEVKLDDELYFPSPPGWADFTSMGAEQLVQALQRERDARGVKRSHTLTREDWDA